jgi:hypothetical protein
MKLARNYSPGGFSQGWRAYFTPVCRNRKRQPLAAYRFGGLECMLLGPGEGGLMSMIG